MTITLSSLASNTQTWAQTPSTADVSVTVDGAARTLTGMAAAAYLFGQALTTVAFQDTLDGVQLSDARFEFPPASGQRVPLAEVANALRYKYGVDPLIEFAPGLGVRGYSIPDINRILELLNREFAGQFSLTPLSSTAVLAVTKAGFDATIAAQNAALYVSVATYLEDLATKARALKTFYTTALAEANVRIAGYQTSIDSGQITSSLQPFTSAILLARSSAATYQTYLNDINGGLSKIESLRVSASSGGSDFNIILSGYRTAGITDVFADLKKYDVAAALLWNAPQSFVTCNLPTKFDPTGPRQIMAVGLNWTQVGFGLPGSPQLFDSSDPNILEQIYSTVYAAEASGSFGEFDWNKWKAGTEVVKGNLGQTSNLWSSSIISTNLKYGSLPNGYTDAAFADPPYNATAVSALLNTASTPILAGATDTELRQNLTEGGDLYTDRFGAFYLNGVRTQAMDVAVTSRLLVQDNVSAEYKLLMDELAERNNLIAAARTVLSGGKAGLEAAVRSLAEQYGMTDVLSELTAGQYSDAQLPPYVVSTNLTDDTIRFNVDPGWLKGTPVEFTTTGGGVTAGKVYYVRPDGTGGYSFFESLAKANSTGSTAPVDLKASITSRVMRTQISSTGTSPISVAGAYGVAPGGIDSDVYSQYYEGYSQISAPGSALETGDAVYVTRNVYNYKYVVTNYGTNINVTENLAMAAGSFYYLRKLANGNYEIFDTYAKATSTGDTGRIHFDARIDDFIGGSQALDSNISDSVRFQYDPLWINGTAVRIFSTDAYDLEFGAERPVSTSGVDFYVRSDGLGNYSFYDTAAHATATGDLWPTAGRLFVGSSFTSVVVTSVADLDNFDDTAFTTLTALLNTLISNKVRDGDLDQAKLQTLTAQLQNNTEAMTALIKAFTEMNAQLAQALR